MHAGLAQDKAASEAVTFPSRDGLFVYGFEGGPAFPKLGSAMPADRAVAKKARELAKAAEALLAGGEAAGLLDLD